MKNLLFKNALLLLVLLTINSCSNDNQKELEKLKLENHRLKEVNKKLKDENKFIINNSSFVNDDNIKRQMKNSGYILIAPSLVKKFQNKGKLVIKGLDNKFYINNN
jgi:hypothetical protein